MSAERHIPGSIDRRHFDLYHVTGDTIDAALLVTWDDGRIFRASPTLDQYVGMHIKDFRAQCPNWVAKLVPHSGYEAKYEATEELLAGDRAA